MRSFVGISLALAAITQAHQPSGRKSLSYGHENPYAKFVTTPMHILSFPPLKTPRDIALRFLSSVPSIPPDLLPAEGLDFIIREDSYTDERTGVSHIYVRQLWNGIQVADGNIALNILDGDIMSYSDSFFYGESPKDFHPNPEPVDHHGMFCAFNSESGSSVEEPRWSGEQFVVGSRHSSPKSGHVNCNTISTVERARTMSYAEFEASPQSFHEPQTALLHFMIAAHPSPEVAESILDRFDEHRKEMKLTYTHHLTGPNPHPSVEIQDVPGAVNPVKAELVYVQSDEPQLSLAWKFEIEMQDNWYEAYMDFSYPPYIHTVIDWASDAPAPEPKPEPVPKYHVWKWGTNDPSEGGRSIEVGFDKLASPLGWHSLPAENDPSLSSHKDRRGVIHNTTTTWGNNVFAHENWEGANEWVSNYRPEAEDLNFDYAYGPKKHADEPAMHPKDYINLTITQLFYTSNMVHDLFYRYGFDEVSGNFQQYNFGKGGKEGDAVIANAQDGSGYNNANFMTPPDGQNGRCRMYVWNTAVPFRDGDLEAGIVVHELAHGLSTRLTGGPANSGCLGWGESGGMGEGWGDWIATTVRSTRSYKDYPMGAWAANEKKGIRNYPYSTNMTMNPSTYKTLDRPGYWGVHAIGEVWAEILWVVEQRFIKKHGFTDSLFPPQPDEDGVIPEGDFYHKQEFKADGRKKPLVPKHGNSLLLQLVVDAMKLQPCRPSFFDARDAIIQADEILTGGENKCELWSGFSERGLGPDATIVGSTPWGGGIRTDDFELPHGVCGK